MTSPHEVSARLPALAARAQLGNRAALEELLHCMQEPLRAHITSIVGDSDIAADVLQESLLLICRHLGKVSDTRWVRAWAYRIATREAVRVARKSRNRLFESIDSMSPDSRPVADRPGDELFERELVAELPGRIAALPASAQIALRMHYLDSLTQAEIAAALEIPLGTVKSRIAYGLHCLRRDWVETGKADVDWTTGLP